MIKRKKILATEIIPEFDAGIEKMPEDSKIFVDKSLEIADYIFRVMEQKGMKQKDLAEKMGKSEAEVSKLLAGMHNYTLRSISKMEAALGCTIICTPSKTHYSWSTVQLLRSDEPIMVKRTERENYGLNYETKIVSIKDVHSRQQLPKAK